MTSRNTSSDDDIIDANVPDQDVESLATMLETSLIITGSDEEVFRAIHDAEEDDLDSEPEPMDTSEPPEVSEK